MIPSDCVFGPEISKTGNPGFAASPNYRQSITIRSIENIN